MPRWNFPGGRTPTHALPAHARQQERARESRRPLEGEGGEKGAKRDEGLRKARRSRASRAFQGRWPSWHGANTSQCRPALHCHATIARAAALTSSRPVRPLLLGAGTGDGGAAWPPWLHFLLLADGLLVAPLACPPPGCIARPGKRGIPLVPAVLGGGPPSRQLVCAARAPTCLLCRPPRMAGWLEGWIARLPGLPAIF